MRLLLPLLALLPAITFAQGTDLGAIRGSVTDSSGAAIAKASVAVTDLATNSKRQITSNNEGVYEAFGLNPGTYRVTVDAPGFNRQEINGINLTGSAVVSANAVLQVAGSQQTVAVEAETEALHTEDQTISQTLNNQ